MIHSLSGGVISDGTVYSFAKVRVEEMVRWYLNGCGAQAGDTVLVPFGGGTRTGRVERVESQSAQTAPVSVKHAAEIVCVCQN